MDLRSLAEQHRDIIAYGFFGVLTTIVNIVAYWVCAHPLGRGTVPASMAAWLVSVLFAYVTNRRWVFHSEVADAAGIARECAAFFAARLVSGAVDWGIMWLFVDVLHCNDVVVKVVANVVVIVMNYVASKLFVFRKDA